MFNRFAITAGTPKAITPAILGGVREQCPTALPPVFVRVRPHPRAVSGRCYANVDMAVREAGDWAVAGWAVWELPGVLATLEHHAVVETDAGFLDVSRHSDGATLILFAPDPATAFSPPEYATSAGGTNRFFPLSGSPLAARLADVKREQDRLVKSSLVAHGSLEKVFNNSEWRRLDAEGTRLVRAVSQHRQKPEKRRGGRGRRP